MADAFEKIEKLQDKLDGDIQNMHGILNEAYTEPEKIPEVYQKKLSNLQSAVDSTRDLTHLQKKENATSSSLLGFLLNMNSRLTQISEEQKRRSELGEDTSDMKEGVQKEIDGFTVQLKQITDEYKENSNNKREKFNEVFSNLSGKTDE